MNERQFREAVDKGKPIEGEDLSAIEWADAQCTDAHFIDCTIEDAQLKNTVLTGAHFARCRLIRCRFPHTDFRGATFEDCIFTDRAESKGSTFVFTELRDARFI